MLNFILLQLGGDMTGMFNIAIMVAMMGIFYFLIFRPQLQRQKQLQSFQANLKKGDHVVTSGGIFGKIIQMNGDHIILDIARGTHIKVATSAISMELSQNPSGTTPKTKAKSRLKAEKEEVENS